MLWCFLSTPKQEGHVFSTFQVTLEALNRGSAYLISLDLSVQSRTTILLPSFILIFSAFEGTTLTRLQNTVDLRFMPHSLRPDLHTPFILPSTDRYQYKHQSLQQCFRTELVLAQLCQHAGCSRVGEVLETAGYPKYYASMLRITC